MLKSLEVVGFKSFAKKTSLEFKSRVTAIVGPNGSGKSNIAEAFRFALGEQSIKSMRGKRGEDLIWNGSGDTPRSNRAGVKLIFDNRNKNFKFDFDEIVIERVVVRDGGNEYYLNSSLVRLKDIYELLGEAHIGASGHHIISQGEADRILTANIKERREMIEDALGLKIYQYKREESQKKLLKTEENIKQVESLRREIAPHIKFLKKQVEKVEKAEELKNKLTSFYREYLKRESVYLKNQRENLESERTPLQERLGALEKEMEEAKTLLISSKNKDEKSEELIAVEDKIKNERNQKDSLYREIGKIEGEINVNERNLQKIKLEAEIENNKVVLLSEIEQLEREVVMYTEIQKIIEKIRDFIAKHKSNNDNKKTEELIGINQKLEKIKNEIAFKIKEVEENLNICNLEYQRIKISIEKEKDSGREAEKNIFKIEAEQSGIRIQIESLKEKENRLRLEENDWKREIQEGGVLLGAVITGFESLEISDLEPASAKSFGEAREERRRELEKMKIRLEELGGAGGSEVTKEYKETVERDEFLIKEIEDLKKSAESLQILIQDLLSRLDTEFKTGMEKINKSFQEYFALMFGGGNAELKIEKLKIKKTKDEDLDLMNPPSSEETDFGEAREGIEIEVSLPKKRTKGLDMLSGGERALTSIALLFAISSVNPPPFIILDETDAALDEANSKKYGDMIESLSKVSQLILITHNRETMSRAGVIYGVTMDRSGVSRLLSIAFDEAVVVAK